ncbi:hypothetical protein SAMN02927900_02130 [Rhizobium mongolense subsp. loessense]|uniref:Uncharacterized protein n=1 Tax=Rhizobium mongolense subsp. loessense TaxID=158890 RepID=A0A1G4R128_9HYPH|nr:hypothetical protein SAMN02927900_02130 [Rhizobium mongolense subsp. loessense]
MAGKCHHSPLRRLFVNSPWMEVGQFGYDSFQPANRVSSRVR